MYGENYGYRSSLKPVDGQSPAGESRYAAAARAGPARGGPGARHRQQTTARRLAAYPEGGAALVGMDPTIVKFSQVLPGGHSTDRRLLFPPKTFRRNVGDRKANIVHVRSRCFYDLEDPLAFVQQVSFGARPLTASGTWNKAICRRCLRTDVVRYDSATSNLEYYALRQIRWLTERAGL